MRTVSLPVAVLALVVLAGCIGGGPQGPDATTTDAADGELAPGLSERGVESPDELATAHRSRLEGRSLTLESVRVERYANGSLRSRTETTIRAASNRSVYRVSKSASGPEPALLGGSEGRLELWANGTHVFRALAANGSTSYGLVHDARSTPAEPRDRLRGDLALADELRVLFTAFGDERVERIERKRNLTAPVRYRVTASELAQPDLLGPSDAEARNATVTAVVEVSSESAASQWASVRNYTVRYTTERDGETVRVTERYRFSDVGETSVERPSWRAEMANRTGET